MEIRPQEACNRLIENANEIASITDKIILARTDVAMLEAALIDAKAAAYHDNPSASATAVQLIIQMRTNRERKELLLAECKLKNFQDQLNVLETANNNYKMAIKMMDTEIKNLNLQ